MINKRIPYEKFNTHGIFEAKVVSNQDPKHRERIKVQVIGMHDLSNNIVENSIWADHCAPYKSSTGDLPEIGDLVYIMFKNKNINACIWIGFVRTSVRNGDSEPAQSTMNRSEF